MQNDFNIFNLQISLSGAFHNLHYTLVFIGRSELYYIQVSCLFSFFAEIPLILYYRSQKARLNECG